MSALLEVDDIHTAYGLSRVLFGVSLQVARRRVRLPARAQRRRQDDDHAQHHGPDPAPRGPRRVEGPRHHRLGAVPRSPAPASASSRRTGASSRISPCWENLDVAGAAAGRPGRWTVERVFDLFPKLRELARPAGRVPLGRRAADAHDRPHADGQPRAAAARRAVRGAGAAGGRAAARSRSRGSSGRASRSCSPSRTSTSRWTWPTGSTCSRRGTSASRAPRREFRDDEAIRQQYLAL